MSVKRYWADALHPHEPRGGSIYVKSPVVFAADYDAVERERDELIGMREEVLHYQREFHRLRDERDEAVALLREAQNYVIDVSDYPGAGHPYKQAANDCWQRIDAFLAKLEGTP